MIQEEKQLLLVDLSTRLPYGVIIQLPELFTPSVLIDEKLKSIDDGHINDSGMPIETVKPYLRPMESMTDEEDKEWQLYKSRIVESCDELLEKRIAELHDWFCKKHIDYRGLIPKSLALEAPEGMY